MNAIVTGHSRGLGAAIAEALLMRGIPVLGLARQTNSTLADRYAGALDQVLLDLSDTARLADWLRGDALSRFLVASEPTLLVNNAAMLQPIGPVATHDISQIARAVSLNVAAPLMLASALAARHAGELRVLHVSSGAARTAYAGWSVYCATKAALDLHARAVALENRPDVRICSLAPGVIDTAMQEEVRATPAERFPLLERFLALKRDGMLTQASEAAARLVRYLLSADFGHDPVADVRDFSEPQS